jgi:hypothetical protein
LWWGMNLNQPSDPPLTLALPKRRTARRERGLTEVSCVIHRPEISSRTQVLRAPEICSLSPSPLWGEGWGEGGS